MFPSVSISFAAPSTVFHQLADGYGIDEGFIRFLAWRESQTASQNQSRAAKENVKKAQRAARSKKTISKLPKSTRREMGKQGAKARQRGGKGGHALEDRTRQELYQVAKKKNIPGRSRMGKWDLIKAIRKAG